jgi:hypothetical protein
MVAVTMSDEALPTGSPALPADVVDLRRRVSRIDDRLFLLQQVPIQTPFTVEVLFDRLEELSAGLDRFAYVVDLTQAQRPDAPTRELLKQRIFRLNKRLAHVSLVGGSNVVMRALAKLVVFAGGVRSFSFHESVDDATEACRRALR